jgi:hypothetical protein
LNTIIGRVDKADFPELSLTNISLKVDTGAYTSSIHCHDINEVVIDNEKYIEFQLLDPSHLKFNNKKFKTKRYQKKSIKNSFGISEERFVVETVIVIFGKEYPIELSLSERSDMKYPILIGRKMLSGRFIVDTSKVNLSYRLKRKNKTTKNKIK